MYKNYIFDFYGTLADIHTDEQRSDVWEKMALFYGYYCARYKPGELKEAYERIVRRAEQEARDICWNNGNVSQKEEILRIEQESADICRNGANSIRKEEIRQARQESAVKCCNGVNGIQKKEIQQVEQETAVKCCNGVNSIQKEEIQQAEQESAGMCRNRTESVKSAAERSMSSSYEGNPEICLDKVFRQLFTDKGIQPQECLVLHAGQFFRALTTDYIRLYEGVPQMLHRLRQKGRTVCLLTNAQRIFTEYELQLLGIAEYFDKVFISSDYGMKKPDIRFFQALMDSCRLKAEESLMIGNDGICDISGAKRAGMDAYYVHSNLSPEYAADVDADFVQMDMDIGVLCRTLGI